MGQFDGGLEGLYNHLVIPRNIRLIYILGHCRMGPKDCSRIIFLCLSWEHQSLDVHKKNWFLRRVISATASEKCEYPRFFRASGSSVESQAAQLLSSSPTWSADIRIRVTRHPLSRTSF